MAVYQLDADLENADAEDVDWAGHSRLSTGPSVNLWKQRL